MEKRLPSRVADIRTQYQPSTLIADVRLHQASTSGKKYAIFS